MPVNQSKQNSLFFFFFSETQKQGLLKDSILGIYFSVSKICLDGPVPGVISRYAYTQLILLPIYPVKLQYTNKLGKKRWQNSKEEREKDSDEGDLGSCKEQSVTQQPFKSKEAGCQNSVVAILNMRLQTIWGVGVGGRCRSCDIAGTLCSRSDL